MINIKTLENLIIEIEHGKNYLAKALARHDGNFASERLAIAYGKMLEAKELLVCYHFNESCYDSYWESNIPSSAFIEDDTYSLHDNEVSVDKKLDPYIHVKFLRLGTKELSSKLSTLIKDHSRDENMHFIKSSLISLQIAYIWLREELLWLKSKNPAKHSSPATKEELEAAITNEKIEKRLTKKQK